MLIRPLCFLLCLTLVACQNSTEPKPVPQQPAEISKPPEFPQDEKSEIPNGPPAADGGTSPGLPSAPEVTVSPDLPSAPEVTTPDLPSAPEVPASLDLPTRPSLSEVPAPLEPQIPFRDLNVSVKAHYRSLSQDPTYVLLSPNGIEHAYKDSARIKRALNMGQVIGVLYKFPVPVSCARLAKSKMRPIAIQAADAQLAILSEREIVDFNGKAYHKLTERIAVSGETKIVFKANDWVSMEGDPLDSKKLAISLNSLQLCLVIADDFLEDDRSKPIRSENIEWTIDLMAFLDREPKS